jgi:recombination associated protein RdgC
VIPRNVVAFTFPPAVARGWFDDSERHEGAGFSIAPPPAAEALHEARLRQVGPLELASQGFVPPMGSHAAAPPQDAPGLDLFHRSGQYVWLCVGGLQKILPASVVNAQLAEKLAEIEQREGRRPGGRARKRLRDELVQDLLPKALVKPARTDAWIDLDRGLLLVDTPSRRRAEAVASELRRAFGSFPALPVNCEVAPRAVLTGWLVEGIGPDWDFQRLPHLGIGEAAHLADPSDHGGTVRIADQELHGDEIGSHLQAGKQVTRLRLQMDDSLLVDVGEDMVLRRLRLLDGATAALEGQEREDIAAELAARFALSSGLVGTLTDALAEAFRWSQAEG